MKVYTSYFANIRNMNLDYYCPVAISAYVPAYLNHLHSYRKLAPSKDLLSSYKNGLVTQEEYIERYKRETLSNICIGTMKDYLLTIARGRTIVLVCYEKPEDFCHRHLVAEFLREVTDWVVEELPNDRFNRGDL